MFSFALKHGAPVPRVYRLRVQAPVGCSSFQRWMSSSDRKNPQKKYRSAEWFGKADKDGFVHRSWLRNQGLPDHVFDGRPIIGICNTWSELTPCNAHFRELAEYVKRGIWEAGGVPFEFPIFSTGESLIRPTAMLYRNLMAMDTEEALRGYPLDGAVLLSGCDKTTPGPLMGAASVNLPTIVLSGGPMLNGKYRGGELGSGTDVWRFDEQLKTGELSLKDFMAAEACMSRSKGHCNTMGTASTMACMVESLGASLPGNAAIPAADSRRNLLAHLTGRRIVKMVEEDLTLNKILTRKAFENAIIVNAAIGGSTNAVPHLLAMAKRLGVSLTLDDWDSVGSRISRLLNLRPAGKYLMEDFYYAGGLPALMKELLPAPLHGDSLTANGRALADNVEDAEIFNRDVIASRESPFQKEAGICVLKGSLAPTGAIIKPSAATPSLLRHKGRAVVFKSKEDYDARIDDPHLDIDENCVMVMKGAGPVGYPGMPEVGNFALPKKLLAKGIKDMVRVSDARMSGTAYGTAVLHTSPESAVGGPLALVQDGDIISLDVENRSLNLEVSTEELQRRRSAWVPPEPVAVRGYSAMYIEKVLQADQGCDFDFLVGSSGAGIPRESH